ncbi:hypothetical protein [Bradyrhizobium sp. Ash2021]|uniref:hypothetical protein n=1 Tax=Bradyrhizobium sp. Ash2021 TaxID=2954771 RepID=UPI002814CD1C|nr:hypothetical protein [Bradyrhizobium sp. Ash2021]WMT79413.1 hypothetical protein NL528_45925 [Bradyrhizobium sp. Ash2021]
MALENAISLRLARQGVKGYSDQPLAKLIEMPERSPGTGEVRVRVTAAALNPLDAKLTQGHMQQATLDRLAKLAANSELGVETAGSFPIEQAPTTFRAFVAGTLPGKHIMQGEDK